MFIIIDTEMSILLLFELDLWNTFSVQYIFSIIYLTFLF